MIMEDRVHSSPNRMVWEYFQMLANAISRAESAANSDIERQETVVAIVVAVTAVEVFLNLFFRAVADENDYIKHKEWILHDIDKRITLDEKLKKWPLAVFGKGLSLGSKSAQSFMELKKLRNHIVHFTSNHETVVLGNTGIMLHGAADSTRYDSLNKKDAYKSRVAAWGIIEEIFMLRGLSQDDVSASMHVWCGMPSNKRLQGDAAAPRT